MITADGTSLKMKIEELKHAVLKADDTGSGASYLVDTYHVTDDGHIYCFCQDCIFGDDEAFNATLKYINKDNGEYLIVRGTAAIQTSAIPQMTTIPASRGTIFKVKIMNAQYFEREESMFSNLKRKAIWKLKQGWTTLLRKPGFG